MKEEVGQTDIKCWRGGDVDIQWQNAWAVMLKHRGGYRGKGEGVEKKGFIAYILYGWTQLPFAKSVPYTKTFFTKQISPTIRIMKRVYLGVSETPLKETGQKRANMKDIAMQLNCPVKITITWKIARNVYGNPKHNFCRLCLIEKLLIIKFPNQDILLSKRSEYRLLSNYIQVFFK